MLEQKTQPSVEYLSNKTALILIFIIIVTWVLTAFVDWNSGSSNDRPEASAASYVSQQSPEFSFHHDEFNELILKPNRTYTIVFDEPGESGLINMTSSANPVRHYRIETTNGCTVQYTKGQSAYVPPEQTGIDVKLPVIIRRNLQFRIKNTEDSNSIIITTSG